MLYVILMRYVWCPEPESNRYRSFLPTDFKSVVSTNFTTRAMMRRKREGLSASEAPRIIQMSR